MVFRPRHSLRPWERLGSDLWFVLEWPEFVLRQWRAAWREAPRLPARTGEARLVAARDLDATTSDGDAASPAFSHVAAPCASIVVPAYNHLDRTRRCLQSIARSATEPMFEVIVVDDGSTDGSAAWLAGCDNVRVHRMPANSGFIAACNAGASLARGRYLVFLNNDTEVRPGWLKALLDCHARIPDCGLVGAKLIGADGRLQEAGGVVFADGRALNYGRGGNPEDPRYTFLRDVDYCSGACIAVSADLFRQLGGFDERYAPAYYEDTDLAFAIRAAGGRVLYQPRAEVVHAEGATAGTDPATGVKRYQRINRDKFVAKWRGPLAAQPTARDFARHPERCVVRSRAPVVLVVDLDCPRPERDSGSMRMYGILQLLRGLGCHVLFWALNAVTRDASARALEDLGIEIVLAPSPLQRLRWWHANGSRMDCVWLARLPTVERSLRLARHHAPRAMLVFDTVDLHFLRYERAAVATQDKAARTLARRFRRTELGAVGHADTTLVVSSFEAALLHRMAPGADVRILSNIHTVAGRHVPWSGRAGLLFVGNFEHAPNVDAAQWLLDTIMPELRRRLQGVVLHIAGYAADRVLGQPTAGDVIVHGFVPDLDPLLDSVRVALAPLRYGAGVKGKINLAMSRGLPVVTTPVGAEGMQLTDRHDVVLAGDAGTFAAAVAEVYADESFWRRLSDSGMENVKRNFSPAVARNVLAQLLGVVMPSEHATGEALGHAG